MPSPGQYPLKDPREENFAREYSRHGVGSRAVVAAGYNVKTWADGESTSASVTANRILKRIKVQQRIQFLQENRARKADFTELRILTELKRIAFFDSRKLRKPNGDITSVEEWDDSIGAALAGMKVEKLFRYDEESERKQHVGYTIELKNHDKLAAIKMLMQYYGMVEVPQGDGQGGITNNFTQVNFYLPENKRHGKVVNGHAHESVSEAGVTAERAGPTITLPAKRTNGHG